MMMGRPKRGLFGNVMLPGTPGIGDGIEEQKQRDIAAEMGAPGLGAAPQDAPRPGLFGQGGVGRAIAGTIGDTLLQHNGMDPVFAPAMQAQRVAAAELAAEQRKRSLGLEDYEAKKQIDRRYPAPTNNDTVADYEFIRQTLGDEAAALFLKNKADPPQYRQGPDGQFYRVQVGQGAPTAPVGKLTPITGGPTPQASGGFRR